MRNFCAVIGSGNKEAFGMHRMERSEKLRKNLQTENEVCVGCGFQFDYPKSLHIHHPKRNNDYIEGVGQLCTRCGVTCRKGQ